MWTMRMESKHKVFTKIANSMICFKNITYTLATRYQQTACLKTDMFSNSIVSSKRKKKFKNSVKFNIYKASDIFDDNLNYSECDSLDF